MTDSPRLWLRCGKCPLSNLDKLNGYDGPTPDWPGPSEGRRRDGKWTARPDENDPTGWSYTIKCRKCGTEYPISGQEITGKLKAFAATGKRRVDWYLTSEKVSFSSQ